MAGWEVEREPRTACRPAVAHGDSPLMPSQSQGAERRSERRAGRTGSRWVLRALVVGGLAGAAWLLTGTAAYAADPEAEPTGSLLGSVPRDVATVSGDDAAVGELLKAAVQPLESAPKTHRRPAVTSILTAPERVLSGPVETLDEVVHDGTAIDAEPVDAVPRTVIAPPRTSGDTADGRTGIEPAETAADVVTDPEPARVAPAEAPVDVAPVTLRDEVHVRNGADRARTVTPPAPLTTASGSTRVSRTPAGGPGASPEGGSAAVLPIRAGNPAVDHHLRRPAPDVEVRRHDAEAPTVSPD